MEIQLGDGNKSLEIGKKFCTHSSRTEHSEIAMTLASPTLLHNIQIALKIVIQSNTCYQVCVVQQYRASCYFRGLLNSTVVCTQTWQNFLSPGFCYHSYILKIHFFYCICNNVFPFVHACTQKKWAGKVIQSSCARIDGID